jgi:formylglycine-generating enzyme required for sulfatase activity
VSTFQIQVTEVTQAMYKAVMGVNPSAKKTNANFPVTHVSWEDYQRFIERLNQITGKTYRLPTEAEWE